MKLIFLSFLFALTGCSTPQKTTFYSPHKLQEGMAMVYIYRSPTTIHSANPDIPKFYINGSTVGKLRIGGYYAVPVNPGKIEVYHKDTLLFIPLPWTSRKVEFVAESGKSYYVKYGIETMFLKTVFKVVTEDEGKDQIKETQLLED